MRDTDLFQLALGLQSPWMVTRSEFAVEDGRLDLYVDFPRGSRFACAECGGEGCGVHDTKDETWRHLDFFQHRTLLHARVPRVICPKCGVRKVATPWARAGSGFTLLFEAYVLALAKAMPIANAAKLLGEHDTRLWRIVEHYVWRAVEALDLSDVQRIAADETSARRGHDYISLFVDMARRKVVYVADSKDAATVKEFADFLEAHGGEREAVTDASIDMGAAFEAGIKANFENAEITFDKFARRFLDRWNAWVQVCDLGPMKRLAKTIMAKAGGILRSIATGLSNGVLEAINGNVQAAKRKAKGYRTKRNLKAIVYLIAGDVLANSPT